MRKLNIKCFSVVESLLIIVIVGLIGFVGWYIWHNRTTTSAPTSTTTATTSTTKPTTHTSQEAVAFAQKTYDDYLAALYQANKNVSANSKPVAQVGLAAVKNNLSSDLYAKAAAVTQATPFSCTAQYVTDKYTASLSSSDKTNAVVAISISNGSGLHTDGMTATVDMATLKITSVNCPK